MSETVVLLLEVAITRPALVGYLDAAPFSAARWRDWAPLFAGEGPRSRWHGDEAGFAAAVDAGLAPTNRALAATLLAGVEEPRIAYDARRQRLTLSALQEREGVVALGPFLVFARGLANAMRGQEDGLASVRVGDVDLMGREADMVALVAIGADSHSDLLHQQRDPARYAASARRSNRLYLAALCAMAGETPPRHSPLAPVTAAMLVERIERWGPASDAGGRDANRWQANLAAIR